MGRIKQIENLVNNTLSDFSMVRMVVRGRPQYLDPALDAPNLRFATRRGSNFTSLLPDNQAQLSSDALKAHDTISLVTRPPWFDLGSLLRIGPSEEVGELHRVVDLIGPAQLQLDAPLLTTYVSSGLTTPNVVSLVGSPMKFFAVAGPSFQRQILLMESFFQVVPGDTLLLSPTPTVYESFAHFSVTQAVPLGTRPGLPGEPLIVYRYQFQIASPINRIGFDPTVGLQAYLRAQPLYWRGPYGVGDIQLPGTLGPCLVDQFSGALLISNPVGTQLAIQTWDSFGTQLNAPLTGGQPWQTVDPNYLLLERPLTSDSLLFWQRIAGSFQYQKAGFFQALLGPDGRFCISTDLLVPPWPSDRQHGWVIPLISQGPVTVTVQFEPQDMQVFTVSATQLTFIRPKLLVDPRRRPVTRMVLAIKGPPNSQVEIRDWQYDGSAVNSISYSMMATQQCYGDHRWLGGGFCVKPLFFNLSSLKAHYSDGTSRYNAGYLYN
jgi:hypothetical protein